MLRKGTPGEGGKVCADSFSYTGVTAGLKGWFTAWVAGPCYWALSHEHTDIQPGTKPCLDWMTEGALRCPRCKPKANIVWVGWLPLYREEDLKPIVVILHQHAFDLVRDLSYPAHVVVGRVDPKSSVFVKKSDTSVLFRTENERRRRPVDITGDLLTMWRLPQLEEWLEEKRHAERKPQKSAPRARSDGKPFSAPMQAAAMRHGCPEVPTDGAAATDAALEMIKRRAAACEPSTNGKHATKREGGDT